MGLLEIKTIQELLEFLPLVAKLHKQFDTISSTQGSLADFVATLTNNFGKNDNFYYGLKRDNELYYFLVVYLDSPTKACFYLLYINKDKRQYTKNLLHTLKAEFKRKGVTEAYWQSTILKRSYERWVNKFGAQKQSINYKLIL